MRLWCEVKTAMKRATLAVLAAGALVGCAGRQHGPARSLDEWTVGSPGGVVQVNVRLMDLGGTAGYTAGRRLYYRALHGPVEVLAWSPLGLTRDDEDFTQGLTFTDQRDRPVVETYTLPRGKRRDHSNRGTEHVLSFRTARGARLDLELRLFDDGFGFRYRFPETNARRHTITAETTGFRPPPGTAATLSPHDRPGGRAPSYENAWLVDVSAGTPSPAETGWSFPALFHTPDDRYLLITEAGLDGTYCGTHLGPLPHQRIYRIAFPNREEAPATSPANPSSSLPWATPWRVVIVGDSLATIVASSLVTDLAAPSIVADTSWILPGRASWSGWSDSASPRSYAKLAAYVDLAQTLGWEYSLVDAGWPTMQGGTWQDLLRHAASRKVGLLFWYDSGVAHGRTTIMREASSRQQELQRLAVAGARGIKVDLFGSDKQDVIKLYLDILGDAARRRLLVNFHGATLPRGWERTYPNLISMEAVRGAEHYRLDPTFASYAPSHHTVLPFTRNAIGPMDYTPVVFGHVGKSKRRTTYAHELALSVVFESGVQHFADAIEGYMNLPDEARSFLRTVPAAWDETHLLQGEPGRLVVIARRLGRAWYVAAINGEAKEKRVTVPLTFLENGVFDMVLLADGELDNAFGITKRQRGALDAQAVILRPNGGFAMRLAPIH